MTSIVAPVKGTRDFYPEDMFVRNWIYQKIREVSSLFGYMEYDAPFLERIDLYAAKSGEELVREQAFVFEDRGGDAITLRPELTPSLARMIAQRQRQLVFPQRWWSFGPFWRYERPQKGRTREFFQWNIDLLGADSAESDAELLAICAAFFKLVGLNPEQVQVRVNSRQLMDSIFAQIGIPPALKQKVFQLIDKRDKLSPESWMTMATEIGLDENQFNELRSVLANGEQWKQSEQLSKVFANLAEIGLGDYFTYDPQVIRGLDYYTGIVFEARDTAKDGRAILGGGHYGNLVSDVGGDPLPGVGFAMGDVMMRLILEKYNCLPEFANTTASVLVTAFDESLLADSLKLASEIRTAGIGCVAMTEVSKLVKQFKYADRIGVPFVIVMGPDEIAKCEVTVKNLVTRGQENVDRTELICYLRNKLAEDKPV